MRRSSLGYLVVEVYILRTLELASVILTMPFAMPYLVSQIFFLFVHTSFTSVHEPQAAEIAAMARDVKDSQGEDV